MAAEPNLTLRFSSDLENVALAGACIRAVCAVLGLPSAECSRVENGAVEGLNNVVEHAYQNHSDGPIELHLRQEGRQLVIEVVDEGLPNRETGAAKLDFDPEDRDRLPEGGLGLFIIQQTMDEVTYTTQGRHHVLRMVKHLPV